MKRFRGIRTARNWAGKPSSTVSTVSTRHQRARGAERACRSSPARRFRPRTWGNSSRLAWTAVNWLSRRGVSRVSSLLVWRVSFAFVSSGRGLHCCPDIVSLRQRTTSVPDVRRELRCAIARGCRDGPGAWRNGLATRADGSGHGSERQEAIPGAAQHGGACRVVGDCERESGSSARSSWSWNSLTAFTKRRCGWR